MDVEIRHNGTDITNKVIEYSRNTRICTGISTLEITVVNDGRSYEPWDTVIVYEFGNKLGVYNVSSTERTVQKTLQLVCQDNSKRLVDYFIPDYYENTTTQSSRYWMERILNDAGINYSFDVSEESQLVQPGMTFGFSSAYDSMMTLLQMNGWYIYFDSNGNAVITDPFLPTEGYDHSLTDSKILQFSENKNDSSLRNRAVVWGATNPYTGERIFSDISIITPWNYDDRDERAIVLSASQIYSNTRANELANEMLREFANINNIKTITFINDVGVDIADAVFIRSRFYRGGGMVTSINSSMTNNGLVTTIIIGEKCPRLFLPWELPPGISVPVYVGTTGSGIFTKTVSSGYWSDFSTGLENLYINDLFIKNGIYATVAGDGYLYTRDSISSIWSKKLHGDFTDSDGILYPETSISGVACSINDTGSVIVGYNNIVPSGDIIQNKRAWVVEFSPSEVITRKEQVIVGSGSDYALADLHILDLEALPEYNMVSVTTVSGQMTLIGQTTTSSESEFGSGFELTESLVLSGPAYLPHQSSRIYPNVLIPSGVISSIIGVNRLAAGTGGQVVIADNYAYQFGDGTGTPNVVIQRVNIDSPVSNEYLTTTTAYSSLISSTATTTQVRESTYYNNGVLYYGRAVLGRTGSPPTLYELKIGLYSNTWPSTTLNTVTEITYDLSSDYTNYAQAKLSHFIMSGSQFHVVLMCSDSSNRVRFKIHSGSIYGASVTTTDYYLNKGAESDLLLYTDLNITLNEDIYNNNCPFTSVITPRGISCLYFCAKEETYGRWRYPALLPAFWDYDTFKASFSVFALHIDKYGNLQSPAITELYEVTGDTTQNVSIGSIDSTYTKIPPTGFNGSWFQGSTSYNITNIGSDGYPTGTDQSYKIRFTLKLPDVMLGIFQSLDSSLDMTDVNDVGTYTTTIEQYLFAHEGRSPKHIIQILADSEDYRFMVINSINCDPICSIRFGSGITYDGWYINDNSVIIPNRDRFSDYIFISGYSTYTGTIPKAILQFNSETGEFKGSFNIEAISTFPEMLLDGKFLWMGIYQTIYDGLFVGEPGIDIGLGGVLKHTPAAIESTGVEQTSGGIFEVVLLTTKPVKVEISKGSPTVVYSISTSGENSIIAASTLNEYGSFYTPASEPPDKRIQSVRVFDLVNPESYYVEGGTLESSGFDRFIGITTPAGIFMTRYDFSQNWVLLTSASGIITSGISASGTINQMETTNFTNPCPYIFFSVSGIPASGTKFFERGPYSSAFYDYSYGLPTDKDITIIRADDIL